jgi:hypothetical protein
MGRRLLGPVRQAALAAAEAARATVLHLDDVAGKSIMDLTAKALGTLAAICEAVDEVSDGMSLTVTIMGKVMPIEIKLNLKEKEDK